MRWHCPPDTRFEIRALAVWGRARCLSVTEVPHKTEFHTWMGKKHFCFFQPAETGNRTPNSSVKGSGANHYPKAPALFQTNKKDSTILLGDQILYIVIIVMQCLSTTKTLFSNLFFKTVVKFNVDNIIIPTFFKYMLTIIIYYITQWLLTGTPLSIVHLYALWHGDD